MLICKLASLACLTFFHIHEKFRIKMLVNNFITLLFLRIITHNINAYYRKQRMDE